MSENNANKPWQRPWSTEEIIQQADNWSLAGDVALLNTMKAFSESILHQTETLSNKIDKLLCNLKETSLKLSISQNEFENLKNTQFIESRVYDDDETFDSKDTEDTNDSLNKSEENEFDLSLSAEMDLLDKYYDVVEISNSDSEDELEKSFVLKPKDIYENRLLPPLIGSDEWYKDWYIEDEISDDSIKSDDYSDSESNNHSNKELINESETSSEVDFSNKATNSTLLDRKIESRVSRMSSSESDDMNSLPVKAPISNKNFAEQLAAKLEEEINTKVIQQISKPSLFSDEPPPLNDSTNNLFSGKGRNLFDDDGNEFDNSEDDLFAPKLKINEKPKFLTSNKPVIPLFDDDIPPSLDEEKIVKKKPTGGVSLFNNEANKEIINSRDDLGNNKKISSLFDDDLFNKNAESDKNKRVTNLFDDEDDDDDLFSSNKSIVENTHNKNKTTLFDDTLTPDIKPPSNNLHNLFEDDIKKPIVSNSNKLKQISLFDDSDEDAEDDLFSDVPKKLDFNLFNSKPIDNIFSVDKPEIKNAEIIKTDQYESKEPTQVSTETVEDTKILTVNTPENTITSVPSNLSVAPTRIEPETSTVDNTPIMSTVPNRVTSDTSPVKETPPTISLFDPTPPLDDEDDWDTKSDSFSTNDEFFYTANNVNTTTNNNKASNLFDNEPPLLFEDDDGMFNKKEKINSTNESASRRLLSSDIFGDFDESKNDMITEDDDTKKAETPKASDITVVENTTDFDKKPVENKPKLDKSPSKISVLTEKLKATQNITTKQPEKKTSPGKLKPTLNINVNALLPGLSQPKIKSLIKPQTNDEESFNKKVIEPIKSDVKVKTPELITPVDLEPPAGFDVTDNVNILPSITKERIRIPVKRKPSTRRGRQEALRASMVDVNVLLNADDDAVGKKEEVIDKKVALFSSDEDLASKDVTATKYIPAKTKPTKLFDDDDDKENEDDDVKPIPTNTKITKLFDNESDDDDGIVSRNDVTTTKTATAKTVTTKLFDDDDKESDDDNDLFKVPEKESALKKVDLFGDEDDDDDLFAESKPKIESNAKKSLFDDNSSDDDLFTSKSKIRTNVDKKLKSSVKKLDNLESTTEDPLSSLLK